MDEPGSGPIGVPVAEVDTVADAAVAAAAADPWATFDRWASWFCLGLALLTGIVGLLVVGPVLNRELHPAIAVLTLAIVVTQTVLFYVVSAGLSRGWTWARPAAFWVLLLAVVTGFGGALVDLTQSKLTIPIGGILGVVILARAPARIQAATPGDARRSTLVGLALVIVTVLPAAMGFAATDVSSPFVTDADDLALAMDVGCEGDGTAIPERIDVRLSWTWRGRDAFPGRPDTVGIGWSGEDDGESLLSLASHEASGPTLVPGGDGSSMPAVDEALAGAESWTWSVGEVGRTAEHGWVTVTLEPQQPRERPVDGSVRFNGVYAHLDRWTVRAEGRCAWGAEATAP